MKLASWATFADKPILTAIATAMAVLRQRDLRELVYNLPQFTFNSDPAG
jgi:hypothetical protein